jgi:hypothetical protein
MRHWLTLLALAALVAAPQAAGAQDIHINPVPPGVKAQWTPVPGVNQVAWAPNLPTDVFRYRGKYYFFWDNFFYQGPEPEGPWKRVGKVPEVFYSVDPAYFKTVKKTGAVPVAPAVGGEGTPAPKAKIIEVAPQEPPQVPAAPASPEKPPKVM